MRQYSKKYKVSTINKKTRRKKQIATFKEISGHVWLNKPNNIRFPEMNQNLYRTYNPEGVSLAFSGGGRRAYSGFIGSLRGLYNIKIQNSNAFEQAQFISAVSGSSWLLGTFLFANKTINKDSLLGKSIQPNDVTLVKLRNINFSNNDFLGNRLINVNIQKYLEKGYKKGIHPEYIWSYAIGQIFLKQYKLHNKIIALNDVDAKKIYALTKHYPITPKNNAPFLICNCAILNMTETVTRGATIFQTTPYYSGTLNTICYKETPFGFKNIQDKHKGRDNCVGGVLQDTYLVGSINPFIEKTGLDKYDTEVKLKIPVYQTKLFTLDNMIGISGDSQVEKFTHISKNIIPTYNLWSPDSKSTTLCPLGDGAYCDIVGITSLLSRNAKHIIAFVSCGSDIKDSISVNDYSEFYSLCVLNLFGLYTTNHHNSDPVFNQSNDMKVFKKSEWPSFAKQILDTKSNGGPVYSRANLHVLPNKLLGIKGGYCVDLLLIVVQTSRIFNNLLPKSIVDTFTDLSGSFSKFPNYPMVNTKLYNLISITKEEMNLLSSYCEWCLINPPLKPIIEQMYMDSGV